MVHCKEKSFKWKTNSRNVWILKLLLYLELSFGFLVEVNMPPKGACICRCFIANMKMMFACTGTGVGLGVSDCSSCTCFFNVYSLRIFFPHFSLILALSGSCAYFMCSLSVRSVGILKRCFRLKARIQSSLILHLLNLPFLKYILKVAKIDAYGSDLFLEKKDRKLFRMFLIIFFFALTCLFTAFNKL